MNIYFKEKQKFNQWWVWLVLVGIGVLAAYGFVQQIILGVSFGAKPMPNEGMIVFTVLVFAFIAFFRYMTLYTTIDAKGIEMKFVPFVRKSIPWEEVQSLQLVHYGFVGYGIRFGSSYGTVYNTKGSKGLWVQLKNGHRFVIGTQKEAELKQLIATLPVGK